MEPMKMVGIVFSRCAGVIVKHQKVINYFLSNRRTSHMHRTSHFTLVVIALLLMVGLAGIQPAEPVRAALPTDLFISEYIEGRINNKAIEIYNGTGSPVDLSDYRLELYTNGASSPGTSTVVLSGELATGDVFVVAHPLADPVFLAVADLTSATVINFDGDDAFALRKISTELFVDVIGQIGFDPGSYWGTAPLVTQDRTLVRKANICAGDTNGSDAFDPATEWDQFPTDTYTYLGSHTSSCAPTAVDLNSYTVNENEPTGKTVGTFTTTGGGVGETFTYSFIETGTYPDNALFTIDVAVLKTAAVFNHEEDDIKIIKVRATGSLGLIVDEVFSIGILDINETPVLAPIGPKSLKNTATLTFTATATDPDEGNTLTWSLGTGAPTWASVIPGTGAVTLSPSSSALGNYPVEICVSDSVYQDCETITVTLTDGVAPVVVSGVAYGVAPYTNITADSTLTFTVPQGYVVSTIQFTLSEPVTIVGSTIVYLGTVPYGTMAAVDEVVTVTPYAGNEVAAQLGTFTFSIPAGSIEDQAGNALATLSASLTVTDQTDPVMELVTPAEGLITLGLDDTFILTVDAFDLNLYELDIDHSFEGILPEFSVYADEDTPWGTDADKDMFDNAGVTISYDADLQQWTIDFGEAITDTHFIPTGVTFYMVLKDEAGNTWGSMDPTNGDNTFAYTFEVTNTLEPEITSAVTYVYSPVYNYVGDIAFDDPNNIFTATYSPAEFLAGGAMNDLARYLGALNYQDTSTVITITYKGVVYTWNPAEPNTGSNWFNGTTSLVSVMVADYLAATGDLVITVGDGWHTSDVTFRLLITNTLDAEIASAPSYAYDPIYTYVGTRVFDDATNLYTVTYDDVDFNPNAMYDLARYLGALHRQDGSTVTSIVYDGVTYTWNPTGTLHGSNWVDGSGNTLVSAVVAGIGSYDPAVGLVFTVADGVHTENVTFKFVILDTTAPVVTISGATDGGVAMGGDLATGYILPTTNDPDINHLLQIVATANEPLEDSYFGLYLTGATPEQIAALEAYYATKTDPYKTYLLGALDGTNPFVYIDGGSLTLVDAAQHDLDDNDVPMVVPDDFPLGTYTVQGVVKDAAGNETTVTLKLIVTGDRVAPVLTITGANADGVAMGGTLQDGYILITNGASTLDRQVQFADGTVSTEPLADTYFGLKLIDSTESPADLKAYYVARGVPEPYLSYLIGAAEGTNPFVYIEGTTVKLVDAAKHDNGGGDVDMTIPDDFPLGTYTVQGVVTDAAGNETTVTLILNVVRSLAVTDADLKAGTVSGGPYMALHGSYADGFVMEIDPSVPWYYLDTDMIEANNELADGLYPFYLAPDTTIPVFFVRVAGTEYTLVDAFLLDRDGVEMPLRINGDFVPGTYTYTGDLEDIYGSSAPMSITITFVNALEVTDADLFYGTDPLVIDQPLNGTFADGFVMELDPLVEYYYLDTDTIVSNNTLADGRYTFYESTDNTQPVFFLDVLGSDFALIDAYKWLVDGVVSPLRINGDFVPGTYTYIGDVTDIYGSTAPLSIEITFNDVPYATAQSVTVVEDTPTAITLSGVDLFPGTMTYVVVTEPTHGTLSGTAPALTYTPAADFHGTDSFTFTVSDGTLTSTAATVSITVTAVNDAPVAVNDIYGTSFETATAIDAPGVLGNDTDVDGDSLTAALVTDVNNGTLVLNADGSFTYTPNTGFNGVDTFTYKANDGTLDSGIATVTITVTTYVNTPPVALADFYETDQDLQLVVPEPGVLDNDYDVDDDILTATLKTNVTNGTLVLLENGSFTYTPNPGFCGMDSFVYTLVSYPRINADGWTADATATIMVYCDPIISSDNLDGPFYVGTMQEFQVTLTNLEYGQEFTNVLARFRLEGITLADIASFQYLETSVDPDVWMPLPLSQDGTDVIGNFGPATGFPMAAPYSATSQFKVTFNTGGTYPASIVLYDVAADPDVELDRYTADVVVVDLVSPVVDITGATVDGETMAGDLATGYILPTTNDPAVDHLLQIDASVDEPLANEYSGLYFVEAESTVSAADLKTYYDARTTLPEVYRTFLKGAADGANPFVYLKETSLSLSLVDAAQHFIQGIDVDMTIPDDFPLGTYVVRGVVADAAGNETTITLTLIVTGDREEPVVVITAATVDGDAMGGDLETGYILPTTNDPEVDHYLQIAATVDAPLADEYFGLYFVEGESTVTAAELQAYYAARGTPDPYLTYLNNAADGVNPFVYIKEQTLSLSLVDAAMHDIQSIDVDMTIPDDFPLGKYVVRGVVADAAGNETTVTLILIVTGDREEPVVVITAATVDGDAMGGDLETGYILPTTNDPAVDHLLQINATVDEPLATKYNGLYFVEAESTVSADTLKAYYDARTTLPEDYRTFLKGAADGTNPFVYLKETSLSLSLVDAAQHFIQGTDVDMTIPDDFPLGKYVVRGMVADEAGNETEVTLILIVSGDREEPSISSITAFGADGFNEVVAVGTTLTVDQGYTVDHTEIVVNEPVTVAAGTVVTLAGQPYGTITVDATGLILIITPYPGNEIANLVGSFVFSVPAGSITDLAGNALETLSLTLVVNNVAPVAVDDAYTVLEDGVLTVPASGVLINDTDFDPAILTAVKVTDPANGILVLNADGSFTYTPDADFHGTDTFTYKANDGLADSNVATVTITVSSVLDAPTVSSTNLPGPYLVGLERAFQVTLTNPTNGDTFTNVLARFRLENITLADIASFQYLETSVEPNVWLPLPLSQDGTGVVGDFGPAAGFPMAAPYSATSQFKVTFNTPGTYPATIVLYDLTADPDLALDSYAADVLVVANFAVTDAVLTSSVDQATWTNLPGNFTDGFMMYLDPSVAWYYLDADTITANNTLADGLYPFYLAPDTTTPIFYVRVVGTDYMLVDAFLLERDGIELPLRINGDFVPGTYTYTGELEDIYGSSAQINIEITFIDALAWLQANTMLSSVSGMVDDLTATFPDEIPAAIVAEDYVIDSRMTLAEALPAGSTVTVYKDGVEILTDITLSGTGPFWFTELFTPDVARAAFDANYGGKIENYSIVVTGPGGNVLDFETTVLIESVISKDGFVTETVLDDITLGVLIPADELAALEWLQANTVLSSVSMMVDDLTATFPLSIPPVIVAEDYLIDSRMTLSAPLPTGSTVTVFKDGVEILTDITLSGIGPFWFTELFTPDAPRAAFDANYGGKVETYSIVVTGPAGLSADFDTTVFIESVISKDEFVTETVLDDITLGIHLDDAVAPVIESGVAKSASHGDVVLVDGAFTVNQGFVVDTIEITMDEDVLVDLGTIVTMVGYGDYGTITANVDGVITITPYPGYGTAALIGTFTFTVPDGSITDLRGNEFTGSILLNVLNVAPVAMDDAYTTDEDVALTVPARGVLVNDTDFDPAILTTVWVSDPANGTLVLNADGSFTYTPDADFHGTDTFTYKATDGLADSNVATVTITVTSVNDSPVLGLIADATIPELVEFSFTATATDADLPAQLLTFSLVGAPEGAAIDAAGVFTWTPSELQGAGVYTFTVKVCDDATPALCDEQDVTLTVTEVNAAPVAQNLSATTAEETPVDVTLMATDAENNPLTYAIVAQPGFGTVTLDGTTATYTPALDFVGEDSFTYLANDGLVDSNVATVTITVTPVNDAPVAVDDDYTMAEKETLTIGAPGVLANDNDVDGDTLTAILVDTVSNGTLTLNADGSFTYTPDEYFNGTDSFTYKANDGVEDSELAIVTITVTPVNDWPIANDDFYEVVTGTELIKDAAEGVLANDVLLDPDEEVSIQILEEPQHGTLSMNDDGSFTYTPDAGFMGTDTFRYLVLSVRAINAEWSDDAVVTIVVNPYMRLFLPIIWR